MRHVALLVVTACAPGTVEDRLGTPAEEEHEITTSNKLSLNKLSLNKLSLNALSAGALEGGADALAATEDGRELLTYVVRCALPEGSVLAVAGQDYPGLIGLAPAWQDGACDEGCQRWVSGCLLAHVNALGVEVPISLRGVHHSLAVVSSSEAEAYPVEEAGFYGDVFVAEDGDLEMYACLGRGLAGDGETSGYLADRLCASSDACGFTRTGVCAPVDWQDGLDDGWSAAALTSAPRSACFEDAGNLGYTGCTRNSEETELPVLDADALTASLWFEVVTVYLR